MYKKKSIQPFAYSILVFSIRKHVSHHETHQTVLCTSTRNNDENGISKIKKSCIHLPRLN